MAMPCPGLISRQACVLNYNQKSIVMKSKMMQQKELLLLFIVIATALIRVLNNASPNFAALANYSPVAAMALFASVNFKGYARSFLVLIASMLVSDFLLYETVYKNYSSSFLYEGWYWVYGALALMAVAGKLIVKNISIKTITTAIIVTVFIHWIVTDLGVWLGSTTYPQTMAGFVACLAAAIPFELRLLTATIIYSAIMFGVSSFIIRRFSLTGSVE